MAGDIRALPEPTGHERKRLVEDVAEPGVDVPVAGRVVGARQGCGRASATWLPSVSADGPAASCTPATWRVTVYPSASSSSAKAPLRWKQ